MDREIHYEIRPVNNFELFRIVIQNGKRRENSVGIFNRQEDAEIFRDDMKAFDIETSAPVEQQKNPA